MKDMSVAIVPKSDQLNSDDLIAGPRTIRVTGIEINTGAEQKVSIHFDGDDGKPYKPCKSMCRVLVHGWGADANKYIGRWMTLYRDASVKWAGVEVGGIRISHLSDIDSDLSISLTATKGKRAPFKVHKLKPPATVEWWADCRPAAHAWASEHGRVLTDGQIDAALARMADKWGGRKLATMTAKDQETIAGKCRAASFDWSAWIDNNE
jgi:hypothetical protein